MTRVDFIASSRAGLQVALPPSRVGWTEMGPSRPVALPQPVFLGGAGRPGDPMPRFAGRWLFEPPHGCLALSDAFAYGDGLAAIGGHLLIEPTLTAADIDIGAWGFFAHVGPLAEGRRGIESWTVHAEALDEAVLLSRRSDFVYGHWLLETLPRVRLAQRLCGPGATFVVNAGIAPYQVEMLERLGVAPDRLFRLEAGMSVACERLIVPSLAHWSGDVVSGFANETYDALVATCLGQHPAAVEGSDRMLITRASRSYDPRPLHNVEAVEAVARRHGYRVVDPGALPWPEQIAAFARATRIVGLSGSGLHNTVYTGAAAHVLVLQPNQSPNLLQTAIAALRGHRVSYLFGESLSAFNPHGSETGYVVDLPLLDRVLGTVMG